MKKTGLVYDDAYLLHSPPSSHPECPERLKAIVNGLKESGLWGKLRLVIPRPATLDQLSLIHSRSYIEEVRQTSEHDYVWLDPDTYTCRESYNTALLAVGGIINAVRLVVAGELDRAFCAVRPPGHHAEYEIARGFCLFNNIAIGAAYAQSNLDIEKVAILDWDVHHGNGTQAAFYSDPSVYYTSVHQYPYYPGSGSANEKGADEGLGFTLNFPLPAGAGDEEVISALEVFWIEEMDKFKPDLLMISAGFDGHADDYFADWRLSDEAYDEMTRIAMRVAKKHCKGRIVSVLEGGYDLTILSRCVNLHISELLT